MPRPTKRKAAYKKVLRDERGKEMNSISSTQKQANGSGLSDNSLSMNDEVSGWGRDVREQPNDTHKIIVITHGVDYKKPFDSFNLAKIYALYRHEIIGT